MHTQPGVLLTEAVLDNYIIGLLETYPVAVKILHCAIADYCAKTAVQEDPAAAATIERDVLGFITVNGQALEAGSFNIVTRDDWKNSCCHGLVSHQAIGI